MQIFFPPLTCGADRWSACIRETMTKRRSTPRTPAPWPGTSSPPVPDTSMWWTWTAPRTAPWPTFDTIAAIAGQGGLYIEVGGGIRDEDRIRRYLDLGVGRCILGTIAVKDFDFTERMAPKHTATGSPWGWTPGTATWPSAAGRSCLRKRAWTFAAASGTRGVQTVIYTDISRDGAEQGTNLALYRELAKIEGWTSPPPAASAVWRSCGSSGRSGPKPPFWARPCTPAVWI